LDILIDPHNFRPWLKRTTNPWTFDHILISVCITLIYPFDFVSIIAGPSSYFADPSLCWNSQSVIVMKLNKKHCLLADHANWFVWILQEEIRANLPKYQKNLTSGSDASMVQRGPMNMGGMNMGAGGPNMMQGGKYWHELICVLCISFCRYQDLSLQPLTA